MKHVFARLLDLPAFVLNGAAVALGIAGLQLLVGALAGGHAAQLVLSGAVCASLADVPNTVPRSRQRVATAALLACLACAVVVLLRTYPLALGAGVALITFVAMMTMAWGPRAGAVSFAPILALVFTVAVPPGSATLAALVGWNAVGGVLYLGWALLAGRLLQRRYTALALADALAAAARLVRARATLLAAPQTADAPSMQAWIAGEADLADRLQSARDFVFAQPDGPRARCQTESLLLTIELRDVLLASRLDLDLMGRDNAARWILGRVADGLRQIAAALDVAADTARRADPERPDPPAPDFDGWFAAAPLPAGDTRARLLPAMSDRLRKLAGDVARIHALQRGAVAAPPLSRAELQRFVAPEGWPLAALKTQFTLASPVFRHALRAGLALACAYFIALALPWASHPHWLVLSVAVVLRGNLEQTLARRNARVLGTMMGCAVVVVLARVPSPALLALFFVIAVGTAHAFVLQRYWLTAGAATVMALLQSHMVHPAGGFAIPERVADTVLGAALAWAFSYVLPSWERRSLPGMIGRVLKALNDYAALALRLEGADTVAPRLARRRAYDALAALAGALQRSAAEPEAVRLPVAPVAALLDHGQRLMAHLSLVRLTLVNRRAALSEPEAVRALADAQAALGGWLAPGDGPGAARAAPADAADDALTSLPEQAPGEAIMPWLHRRLGLLVHDAQRIRGAARDALATRAAT